MHWEGRASSEGFRKYYVRLIGAELCDTFQWAVCTLECWCHVVDLEYEWRCGGFEAAVG